MLALEPYCFPVLNLRWAGLWQEKKRLTLKETESQACSSLYFAEFVVGSVFQSTIWEQTTHNNVLVRFVHSRFIIEVFYRAPQPCKKLFGTKSIEIQPVSRYASWQHFAKQKNCQKG